MLALGRSIGLGLLFTTFLMVISSLAVTRMPSVDGQFWDVQDTSIWAQDSGGIATGGRAHPFNGFGYLKMQVRRTDRSLIVANRYLRGFGLSHDGGERFDSITPILDSGILVSRAIYAPKDTNYLRYFDSFTNTENIPRMVQVVWGGSVGAYQDGGLVAVATTSNGDRQIDASDSFVTVMQNARKVTDPVKGPSGHGPSAHVLGTKTAGIRTTAGDMYSDPFVNAWPGFDPAHIGYVFSFTLAPNQTAALVTFVVKGLSEVYDPRGGAPTLDLPDSLVEIRFQPPYSGADAKIPAAGSEIARVTEVARKLVADPDLRGLTRRQRAQIINWQLAAATTPLPFTAFEKTVPQLQDAMTRGELTAEDLVRDYLVRLTKYDRNGPSFRSILSINPRSIADARALDAERAAGRVRGPFHGIPIVFKDNIDAIELPTTGGARALVDHKPRLDSRMAANMRRGGAIILGKANLDEYPFGDFGISTLGGTIGNAYDPTLNTAGSSGGSATATAASLAALSFGTDTCNSLSNPASFASLATIRTTRGLTSRAGVMPLLPYNDAVGPMTKSVREIALVLDQVAGTDPEDPDTAEANAHITGSFAAALNAASLKGVRIGLLRQRFVGFTGEQEIPAMMDRVRRELEQAGATVVDVTIPNLDSIFITSLGSVPGSIRTAWNAYLARGAKPGEKVLTIEDLLASGKLAPAGVERLRGELQPSPTGATLDQMTRALNSSRERLRNVYVSLMDRQRVDTILYPANQARPHTHEGGLERYGSEPGTCEDSAYTGLPQVTVPAGFMGNRYPFGISFLGRLWDDQKLLSLAFAYEQATHHRRPPTTVK